MWKSSHTSSLLVFYLFTSTFFSVPFKLWKIINLKHFSKIKLEIWEGAVNLPMMSKGQGFRKNWKLMSPRRQKVTFLESWAKQLKVMLWILFLIDFRFTDSWGFGEARQFWEPSFKWPNFPNIISNISKANEIHL